MKILMAKSGGWAALLCALGALALWPSAADAHENLADLVEEVKDSVVNITAIYQPKPARNIRRSRRIPEEFRRFIPPEVQPFFETPPGDDKSPGGGEQSLAPKPRADGSGFILSPDGYIVTSFHVVDNAEKVLVTLQDRREFEAEVVGLDKHTDIALLKVEATELQAAELGNADELRVGQPVAAIGSPFRLDFSVTRGVISALGRAVGSQPIGRYVPFIQTDVAINPGNSGGPLYDMQGRVIGVNAQIFTRTGGYMGLSFSVPVDTVEQVVNQLRENGQVARGWLGVAVQDVTRDVAESMDLPKPVGALISNVLADSPAEKAKFEAGDVIVKLNDKDIVYARDLPPATGAIMPGQKARMEFFRNGEKRSTIVRMGELADEGVQVGANNQPSGGRNRLGMQVRPRSGRDSNSGGLAADAGVVISSVQRSGPAHRAGLKQGDVIVSLDRQMLNTPQEFWEAVKNLPKDKTVWMRVMRNGNPSIITIRPRS